MRMRNSSSRRKVLASDKEYEVAEILLYLPVLFSCFKPTFGIASLLSTSSWKGSKKRSAIADVKEAVAVVKKRIPTTRSLSIPSHSNPRSSEKSRCNSVSKIKTKEELLEKVDELTKCRDTLKREIGKVRKYCGKLLTTNSFLKAMRHQQQQQLKKCCMDPIAQSWPAPKASDPSGGKSCLNMSYNGLAIDRAMDPSSWLHAFELEGGIGVGQVNKCPATEGRKKR